MPAERRLRAVGDQEGPCDPKDPVTALAASAAFLAQQADAVDDRDVAAFLRLRAADLRLEAFTRHAPGAA